MQWGLTTATAVIKIKTCLLPKNCLTKCIVYQASIHCDIAEYKQKCYLGSCERTFKDRFGNHKKLFNHAKHKRDTELSKEFWEKKSAVEHQKSHGRFAKYVVLTIQTSAAFYV